MEKQHLWLHGVLYELTPVKDILASKGKYTKTPEELEEERISKLPKTWEESIKLGQSLYVIGYHDNVYNILVNGSVGEYRTASHSRNQLEALIALNQLVWLRDIYNGDWKPDWSDSRQEKYYIYRRNNLIYHSTAWIEYHLLTFKSKEIANLFIENFKDLIEKTKDLY